MSLDSSPRDRPYPRVCPHCKARAVHQRFESRVVRAKHDGKQYEFCVDQFPVNTCAECGTTSLDLAADDAIDAGLRRHLGFLQPAEISGGRAQLGLSQAAVSRDTGFAAETLSRWESGACVQAKAADRFLRVYMNFPAVREYLRRLETMGTSSTVQPAGWASYPWPLDAPAIPRMLQPDSGHLQSANLQPMAA